MTDAPDGGHPWSAGFRTLAEEHDYRVEDVQGRIPASLRGTIFRNGPGRNALGGYWLPHWFDGDGMVSAFRFDEAGVHYRNRYVRTRSYLDETRAGRILYRGFAKKRPGGILANALRQPANVANTSVMRHRGRLLALWEGGPATALDPGSLDTLGIEDFGGAVHSFSAHPKTDPRTGETFNFGIDYGKKTTLTPYRIDREGRLDPFPPIALSYPVMNHDFVLTERYLVFCLGPVLVHSLKLILGLASFDEALEWDAHRPTRILLVPRDRSGAPKWLEIEPFFQFHFANGYDDNGQAVLDLARYPDYRTVGAAARDFWRSEWPAEGMARLVRLRIDPASGKVESQSFDTGVSNEFPVVDPRRVAGRHRHIYLVGNAATQTSGLQQRVLRVDAEAGRTAFHDFGPGRYPGEPLFVPSKVSGEEEDGTVVTLVFDAARGKSELVGLDARDIGAAPLFVARLKHHVPFPLHGIFVP